MVKLLVPVFCSGPDWLKEIYGVGLLDMWYQKKCEWVIKGWWKIGKSVMIK